MQVKSIALSEIDRASLVCFPHLSAHLGAIIDRAFVLQVYTASALNSPAKSCLLRSHSQEAYIRCTGAEGAHGAACTKLFDEILVLLKAEEKADEDKAALPNDHLVARQKALVHFAERISSWRTDLRTGATSSLEKVVLSMLRRIADRAILDLGLDVNTEVAVAAMTGVKVALEAIDLPGDAEKTQLVQECGEICWSSLA